MGSVFSYEDMNFKTRSKLGHFTVLGPRRARGLELDISTGQVGHNLLPQRLHTLALHSAHFDCPRRHLRPIIELQDKFI